VIKIFNLCFIKGLHGFLQYFILRKKKILSVKGGSMNWYLKAFKNYAVFGGRAQRKEYWYFVLFNIIFSILLTAVDSMAGTLDSSTDAGLFGGIYALVVFVPSIAVAVRRLHDVDKSAWWMLIGIVPVIGVIILFIFMVKDGDYNENRYGKNPKLY
jgi:uncharacterized membrane protein YhaH (DUF805 family)